MDSDLFPSAPPVVVRNFLPMFRRRVAPELAQTKRERSPEKRYKIERHNGQSSLVELPALLPSPHAATSTVAASLHPPTTLVDRTTSRNLFLLVPLTFLLGPPRLFLRLARFRFPPLSSDPFLFLGPLLEFGNLLRGQFRGGCTIARCGGGFLALALA